jgi:hypothetical protein
MRQTQVVVIPSNSVLTDSFPVFDKLVETINQARRNARDYVTDVMLEKIDDQEEPKWSIAIHCGHLHPAYGRRTPEQELQDLKDEEEAGEVDVHLQEYKKARLLARRSPYPTLVIEVQASPPPDFGASPPPSAAGSDDERISAADIQKLEALFGKSAHISDESEEDSFWNAVGSSLTEVSAVTPLKLAEKFITETGVEGEAAFTETQAAEVDEAYEFVFNNVAMLMESETKRQYLVMPHFLSSAATSFEKFAAEVSKMLAVLPDLKDRVSITTFHPEHIDSSRRSPVPILAMQWKEQEKQ